MAVSSVETDIPGMPDNSNQEEQKTLIRPEVLERARRDYSKGRRITGSELSPAEMEELAKSMRETLCKYLVIG